jgi:hypothetical protein
MGLMDGFIPEPDEIESREEIEAKDAKYYD